MWCVMNDRFVRAFRKLMKWEGGSKVTYADFDGHTTKYGIIQETYSIYHKGKSVVDCTEQEAMEIYYNMFWLKNRLDEVLNESIANFVFQGCVNMGNYGFIRNCVQYPLGAIADGKVGKQTLAVLNHDLHNTYNKIYSATKARYETIARQASKAKFLRGWLNRINDYKFKE